MKLYPKKTQTTRAVLNKSGRFRGSSQEGTGTGTEDVNRADIGLGTTYERWALNRFLLRLHNQYHFESVLETPRDGMTGISGINSLILGMQNVPVTLLLDNKEKARFARLVWKYYNPSAKFHALDGCNGVWLPFEDNEFDFVWNFNVMTVQADCREILEEMKRVSKRFIMVCVPNRSNYAFPLHRLHHRVSGDPWDHGKIELMDPQPWQKMFNQMNMKVVEVSWLDCPWWPDIIDPEKMIKDFFPFLKRLAKRARSENRYYWYYDELPYYNPLEFSEIHQRMAKLAYFENSRIPWLKKRFAHHVCVLACKED
jgi:hypothetical protein